MLPLFIRSEAAESAKTGERFSVTASPVFGSERVVQTVWSCWLVLTMCCMFTKVFLLILTKVFAGMLSSILDRDMYWHRVLPSVK